MSGENQGLTYIEVVICLAVFSLISLGIFKMQGGSVKGNMEAAEATRAQAMGAYCLERFRFLDYDHGYLSPGTHDGMPSDADFIDNNANGSVDEPGEKGRFHVSWHVFPDHPVSGVKSLEVRIYGTKSQVPLAVLRSVKPIAL